MTSRDRVNAKPRAVSKSGDHGDVVRDQNVVEQLSRSRDIEVGSMAFSQIFPLDQFFDNASKLLANKFTGFGFGQSVTLSCRWSPGGGPGAPPKLARAPYDWSAALGRRLGPHRGPCSPPDADFGPKTSASGLSSTLWSDGSS